MGLINSLLGRSRAEPREGNAPEAEDSDLALTDAKNNLRRDLVHVVLRDTMRLHGVPSEWMRAAVLASTDSADRRRLHVLLIVCEGHDRMLAYLPAFQESFVAALGHFDGPVSGWMSGLSWQFEGMSKPAEPSAAGSLPSEHAESGTATGAAGGAAGDETDEDLQEDLRKLFAIRDGALQTPASLLPQPDFQPTQPLR